MRYDIGIELFLFIIAFTVILCIMLSVIFEEETL